MQGYRTHTNKTTATFLLRKDVFLIEINELGNDRVF